MTITDPKIREVVIRWMKALHELVDETGQPQPAKIIYTRAGMTSSEGIMACAFASVEELHIKLDAPIHSDHLYEYVPRGER
jgi:hypothetical protein